MQFGNTPERGTANAMFFVRGMQEKYQMKKQKLYGCFVDMEKTFDGIPRKVMELAMRKKSLFRSNDWRSYKLV